MVYATTQGGQIIEDERSLCSADSQSTLDENGVVVIETPHYRVMFPLPSPHWQGWVKYRWGESFAYLNGQTPTSVVVELVEEI